MAKQILVRVDTDGGLTGWGEAFAYGAPLAVCDVIDDTLAPILVGEDPTRIEALLDRLQRARDVGAVGEVLGAIERSSRRQRERCDEGPDERGDRRGAEQTAQSRAGAAADRERNHDPGDEAGGEQNRE